MPDGVVVKAPFFYDISNATYNSASIIYPVPLRVCDNDIAPEYNNTSSKEFEARH
jgi:hypothetical protein